MSILEDLMGLLRKKNPEEGLDLLGEQFELVDGELSAVNIEKGRYLSLFLNEPQDYKLLQNMKNLLYEYYKYMQEYKHTAPFMRSDSGCKFEVRDYRATFIFGNNVLENSNDIDYIGLINKVIRDISVSQKLGGCTYKESQILDKAQKLKEAFYQNLQSVLPDLDTFYGLTRGAKRDAHLANELRKKQSSLPAMAGYFEEFLKQSVKQDELFGKGFTIDLVDSKFRLTEDKSSVKEMIGSFDDIIAAADYLFSSPDTTVKRLRDLSTRLSPYSNFERAVLHTSDNGVLDISQYQNLLRAVLDFTALGYMGASRSIIDGIKRACKILGTSPEKIGLGIGKLPRFSQKEQVVPGLNGKNDVPRLTDAREKE